ncbi:MAG: hypothetical protein KY447_12480 [Actinobacteria bacterium]|nr:hypothetical protein [Actinomycetota bacterium]MBW3643719.1 hypothetical protein [Actinomycetota bacterium]
MKGRWAEGMPPRNFTWVIRDQLAVSERLGGYGASHRRVRRQEEVVWVKAQGFTLVISLLASPHNLHVYEAAELPWRHVPFSPGDDPAAVLGAFYRELRADLAAGERVLVHDDDVGDRVQGAIGGYLVYTGLVAQEPKAITVVEHLLHRQMGPAGRELVAVAGRLGS